MLGEQYWEDGRIRAGPGGYDAYYDAVDSCWVSAALCVLRYMCAWYVALGSVRRTDARHRGTAPGVFDILGKPTISDTLLVRSRGIFVGIP